MQLCVDERTVITPQKGPLVAASKTVIIMSVSAASSSSLASGGSGLRVNNLSLLSGNPGSERQREGAAKTPCKVQGDTDTEKSSDNG